MSKAVVDNPFHVPQELNTNLLQFRKEEQQRRKTEKLIERRSTKLLYQSKQINSNSLPRSNHTESNDAAKTSTKNALETMYKENDILARNSPDGKMSVKEFIAKKREMLLLNLKIDTQHENIEKLHMQLKEREDALKAKEDSLAESMRRFDAFLKETDEKAQDAQRKAEKETAKRIKKQQEVASLTSQLKAVESTISRHRDTLAEYEQCKQLVDLLTPPSWFEECADAKRKRQQQRRRERIKARQEAYRIEQQMVSSDEQTKKGNRNSVSRRKTRMSENKGEQEMTVPDFEDEPMTSSDEECPMYFKNSEQLHVMMKQMEDTNESLLEQIKEGESTLSGLEGRIKELESGTEKLDNQPMCEK